MPRPAAKKHSGKPGPRPLPAAPRIGEAFERLARHRAVYTLVRGALPASFLRRLLRDAMPRRIAAEMPQEVWSSLAVSIALETPLFGVRLAQSLNDHLAWDQEPADLDGWWQVVRERPLEALWMAALSDNKAVRREFSHIVRHCLENYRSSPDCAPPSWEFVEAIQDVHAKGLRDLRDAEKSAEEAERRLHGERERLEELREELKRLRRETSELRAEKAAADRRRTSLEQAQARTAAEADRSRLEEVERRLRKAEKEREHLTRELERARARGGTHESRTPAAADAPADADDESDVGPPEPAGAEDPLPRRRVLRHIVRRLFNKGKIGASHTHEDNVFRGLPDHEKGLAKEAMDALYREGLLLPKPTLTDPHVSLNPDRTGELRAIIEGDVRNPRLLRFVEQS